MAQTQREELNKGIWVNKLPKSELARINGEMKSNVNSAYDEALEMAEKKMEQAKNNTINNLESEMNDSDLEDD